MNIGGLTIFDLPEHPIVEEDTTPDTVNHPAHYTAGAIETIDVIKSICNGQEMTPFEGLLLGNVIKYISRFKLKNGTEDLKKAAWYLDRLIGEQEVSGNGQA